MAAATTQDFKVIGTRPIRHDGVDKVTGRAKYGADYTFPNMLHGKVLRSPYAHAKIISINVEKALALPGVKAVITGKDLPELPNRMEALGEIPFNPYYCGHNVMARDKVLYNGHAVAAVAATSPHIAEEALALIEVEYEPLPPVLTVDAAMEPDAPILHSTLRNKETGDKQTNIASHIQFKRGNVASAFETSEIIIEHEYRTEMVHQGYIEPHNAVVTGGSEGHFTIYTSTQAPFEVRGMTAAVAGIPVGDVKVVPAEIGGGFGGKTTVYLEPLAVLFSRMTGCPVKMVMSRAEVLRASGPTSGSTIRVKLGASKDGKINAAEVWLAYEAGAFPGSPVAAGAMTVLASYNIDNFLVDGYDVVCNRPKTAAYRAPGATNAAFGVETAIDELAEKIGMDPIDLRIQNASKEGTPSMMGAPYKRIGFIEVCEALKNSPHYKSKLEGKNRGRGVGFGFWFNAGMQSSALVNIHSDGTASVVTGNPDIGGSRASMAMIAAEILGLHVEDVRPSVADTDSIGQCDLTGGSRVTMATGLAVYEAANDAIRQMKERAAKLWKKNAEEIDYIDGKVISRNNGVPPLTLKELAAKFGRTGGPVSGRAGVNVSAVGPGFAGLLVDIEVDPETGKIQVLRATIAQDAGKAIHPSYVEGQMQGGTSQGLGWALNEEYIYDDKGILKNSGFLDYRMPTCLDLPLIETCVVEVPNPSHPLGVRGVGEVSIVPPPAAVANALYRAIGVRVTETPMSPPRVLKAIMGKNKSKNK
jgi:xanthine dehydrogenase molybdenum-binding subunit